jgi:hypothetical protein
MAAKIIKLPKKIEPTGCIVERISLQECKTILNSKEESFTDEEVLSVREFLYLLAEINHLAYLDSKVNDTKIIELNKITTHETESYSIPSGEYGRTG